MSTQITWRNIDAPDLAAASRPLAGAQQSFGAAFDTLGQVLQRREATDAANWQTQKGNNTQAFLNELYKFRTPEQLAAARASGELDALQAGFGPQIDQAAVRGAADTRLNTLYDQAKTSDAYTAQQRETRLAPLAQQAKALAVGGKTKELEAFLGANPELAQFKGGDLIASGVIGERDAKRFGWDADAAKRLADRAPLELKKLEGDIKNSAIQANAAAVSAGAAATNADTNRKELAVRTEERLQKQLDETMTKRAGLGATIASPEGTKFVMEELAKTVKDPKALQRLQVALGEIASDPEFKNVTPSIALTALVGDQSTGTGFRKFFWDGTGDGAAGAVRALMKSPDFAQQQVNQEAQRAALDLRIGELRTALYPGSAPTSNPAAPPAPVPAATPTPPKAGGPLNLPAPTVRPSNTPPNRGPAVFPWERRSPEAEKKTLK